ncbi:hypothetical protein BBJ28_00009580 [Nothophytophthora sp. Chile5]|nr:hypothetical protein BBJ28_00009580 [Nothophytophthora sp. Chile5]
MLPPHPESSSASEASDSARCLAQRFARVLTLRQDQRQRTNRTRRRAHRSRNCASMRREHQAGATVDKKRRRVLHAAAPNGRVEDEALDATIRSLQAHIASMERSALLRDSAIIVWRANRSAAALDLSREYFLQFEHGYDPADGGRSVSTERFVASVFRPDILCRDFQGLQPFMDQWEKYTTFHKGLVVNLGNMRLVSGDGDAECVVVHATAEIRVTFTADTLKFLYPSLFTQALQDTQARAIVDSLIGRQGGLPLELVLNFDDEGRVFAYESRVGLVSTLLEVLHDPSAAIRVYQSSLMTADGHWKVSQDREAIAQRERMLPRQLL